VTTHKTNHKMSEQISIIHQGQILYHTSTIIFWRSDYITVLGGGAETLHLGSDFISHPTCFIEEV